MQTYTYVIIGGGIAGTTAAETIRKNDARSPIAIISDEPYPLYSRVLLSKPGFVRGEQPLDSVWLKKPQWYEENNIHLFKGLTATHLDSAHKTITLSDGDILVYDKLLLATGAHARKWPSTVIGADKKGIFYLRGLDDTKAIIEALRTKKRAILIGSGCVSFEIAEVLRSLDIETTLVMRERYFSEPLLSKTEGTMIEQTLEKNGVSIRRNAEVAEVVGDSDVTGIILKDGTQLECDMILCMIGVIYPTDWLKSSGIRLNRGIVANEFLQTNLPDVWVAGDIAEYKDSALKETLLCGNWMNARGQGEIAALGMVGKKTEYNVVTFQTSHGFGNTIGFTGDTHASEDRKVIFRGSPETNSFCRIILRDDVIAGGNVIIGATLINRTQEMGTITKLIKEGVNVSGKETDLADEHFDLKTLVPVINVSG